MLPNTIPMILALALNIFILLPVLGMLMFNPSQADATFGPPTDGRLILTSVYMAIALISAILMVMHFKHMAWAVPMTVALFCVQITYKLITVPMVGLSSPVVITNLVVVVVQMIVLGLLWMSISK